MNLDLSVLWELLVLAFGVSMDAFAVSVCKGLCMKKATLKASAICGTWFGGFQAMMPLIGFFLASLFAKYIEAVDYWVAFGLLALIGANMLKEAFEKDEAEEGDICDVNGADLAFKTMFVMAVATSIDALAVGVSLRMEEKPIFIAIALIGAFTFLMSALGVKLGNIFGSRFKKPAEITGGAILIVLGLKFLIEGLLDQFWR